MPLPVKEEPSEVDLLPSTSSAAVVMEPPERFTTPTESLVMIGELTSCTPMNALLARETVPPLMVSVPSPPEFCPTRNVPALCRNPVPLISPQPMPWRPEVEITAGARGNKGSAGELERAHPGGGGEGSGAAPGHAHAKAGGGEGSARLARRCPRRRIPPDAQDANGGQAGGKGEGADAHAAGGAGEAHAQLAGRGKGRVPPSWLKRPMPVLVPEMEAPTCKCWPAVDKPTVPPFKL